MSATYGLYGDPRIAQAAVDNLRAAGIDDRDITVISSEPFEEYEFSGRDRETWMFWIAGLGGAFGLAFGYWLTSMTERGWPLQTGGMPIVALWPNLVVIFELTMLCGILAAIITLLVTARLPRRRPDLYDPAVSDGRILVGVSDVRSVSADALKRALSIHPDIQVKTIG